ncbi:MAG: hypothetical protein ACMUHB_06900 [Thermoplasmatota archaeon]
MGSYGRTVVDLRSQDLDISNLTQFRDRLGKVMGAGIEELIMFSSANKPYQFSSLDEFKEKMTDIPDNASYFYYTISTRGGERCSLYLDPDRPGKVVIEGSKGWTARMEEVVNGIFPSGGERYKVHDRYGIVLIWSIVVVLAALILGGAYLLFNIDATVISVVIFTSSILGIYLSVRKSKELQPANTISFVKKRRFWVDTVLNLVMIALGIVSAILASVMVQNFL